MLVTDKEGQRPIVWEWLNQRTNLPWSTDLRVIGLMRSDLSIAAAVGYNNWVDSSCFIHLAFDTPRSMTRELIREAFSYPFQKADVIYGLTPITREYVLSFNRRMGFREIYRTDHFVLQEMRIEECRWLKESEHGRRQRISTSGTELHGSGRGDSSVAEQADRQADVGESAEYHDAVGHELLVR